jgi:predicted RNase H-like HicB family nuclease
MKRFTYTVVLIPEGDGYVAHVPALPGCITQGNSVDDALTMAEDAIRVWLHNEPPVPECDGVKVLTATVTVAVNVVDGRVRSPGVIEAAVGA